MSSDLELPPLPEVCILHRLDKNLGVSPEEMPGLMHSLLARGWIWRMPAKYQHIAVLMLQSGVIRDDGTETEAEQENEMAHRTRIQIVVKGGKAVAIRTGKDVVDVEIIDTDARTTVHYSSRRGDLSPLWVGRNDDCLSDTDTVPEND